MRKSRSPLQPSELVTEWDRSRRLRLLVAGAFAAIFLGAIVGGAVTVAGMAVSTPQAAGE